MNQNQLAELFDTSVPNISMHISNILKEGELEQISVIKDYLTTASDGKQYNVTFYALDMVLAIGFRVRSKRGTQFRIWANHNLKEYMVKGFVMDYEADLADKQDVEESVHHRRGRRTQNQKLYGSILT